MTHEEALEKLMDAVMDVLDYKNKYLFNRVKPDHEIVMLTARMNHLEGVLCKVQEWLHGDV